MVGFGQEDVGGVPGGANRAQLGGSGTSYTYRFSVGRALYYASNPETDQIHPCAFEEDGHWVEKWVLFERCGAPPVWLKPRVPNGDHRAALREWLLTRRYLEKRGPRRMLEDVEVHRARVESAARARDEQTDREYQEREQERLAAERKRRAEERDRREAAAWQAHVEQRQRYAEAIRAQAGDDPDAWFDLEVDYGGEGRAQHCDWQRHEEGAAGIVVYRVPRAPFICDALRRTHGQHLAPEWECVCPPGYKVMLDSQWHSDWMLGAGVPIEAWWGDRDDKIIRAAQQAQWKLQEEMLGFEVHVLGGTGSVTNTVLHPKPDERVPAGAVIVIPYASPKYQIPAQTAGPGGAIITEVGEELSHLANVAAERGLRLVRIEGARELYPAGTRITVDCDSGRVTVADYDGIYDG